ncbi:uncharacterized protein SRS1_15652 [Sporisorium reilianum f. sp. reilianum]|uniref:Ubiquitin-like domain-containing protein n=1 Tax=Sporisorium reilianum f. sp. reilianum TaxID=72559 RepID=A0A2N8UKK1_9BASI|nr:uncharacterized protein SRS1_15652 [Sporisorium reilianum f. sp. reilianum]
MDYFRHLGLGTAASSSLKREQPREDSPISDIDDSADGKGDIAIDAGIQAVLDAAKLANAAASASASGTDVGGSATQQPIEGDEEGVKAELKPSVQRDEGGKGGVEDDDDVMMVDAALGVQEVQREEMETERDELEDETGEAAIERRRQREPHPSPEPASQPLTTALSPATVATGVAKHDPPATPTPALAAVERHTTTTHNTHGDNNDQSARRSSYDAQPAPGKGEATPDAAMQASPSPTPPPAPPQPRAREVIAIHIRDANNYATVFKCKPETKLTKLLQAYADRYQADIRKIRFISQHGVQLSKTDRSATVTSAGLEDGDEIDVMLEQIGGARARR